MSEVIYVFDYAVTLDGVTYNAQVSGRRADHIWEGGSSSSRGTERTIAERAARPRNPTEKR
jgi:hypothetical protein